MASQGLGNHARRERDGNGDADDLLVGDHLDLYLADHDVAHPPVSQPTTAQLPVHTSLPD